MQLEEIIQISKSYNKKLVNIGNLDQIVDGILLVNRRRRFREKLNAEHRTMKKRFNELFDNSPEESDFVVGISKENNHSNRAVIGSDDVICAVIKKLGVDQLESVIPIKFLYYLDYITIISASLGGLLGGVLDDYLDHDIQSFNELVVTRDEKLLLELGLNEHQWVTDQKIDALNEIYNVNYEAERIEEQNSQELANIIQQLLQLFSGSEKSNNTM